MKADTVNRYLHKLPEAYALPNIMLTVFFAYYKERLCFKEISFSARRAGKNSVNFFKITKIGVQSLHDFKVFKKDLKSDRQYPQKDIQLLGITAAIFSGMVFRFWIMSFGWNYDFDSYCVVGELARNFHNVYANTERYNYGPVFLCIQGFLFRLSTIFSTDPKLTYRVLIVSLLSFTDLGISMIISHKREWKKGVIFFLNPVSIIITGYHNQFDNIAVLLAMLSLYFYNDEEKINKKDLIFIGLISLSLMTKHILFCLPVFFLLKYGLPLKKKIMYAVIPPIIFLVSFIPFAVCNPMAFEGILNNVFLYRSHNNAPLLEQFYRLIGFPAQYKICVFVLLMCITGFVVRKKSFEDGLIIYFLALVAFSSAVANQYLAIPLAALCLLGSQAWNYLYLLLMSVALMLNEHGGLGQLYNVRRFFPGRISTVMTSFDENRYAIAAWILFAALVYEVTRKKSGEKEE